MADPQGDLQEGAGSIQDILRTYQTAAADINRQIGPELQSLQPVLDAATGQDARTSEQIARAKRLRDANAEMGQATAWLARQSPSSPPAAIPQHVLDIIHRNYHRVLGVPFAAQAVQPAANQQAAAQTDVAAQHPGSATAASQQTADPSSTEHATTPPGTGHQQPGQTRARPTEPTASPPQQPAGLRGRVGALLSKIGRRLEWRGKKLPIVPGSTPLPPETILGELAGPPPTAAADQQASAVIPRLQGPEEHPFLAATRREMEDQRVRRQADEEFRAAQSTGFRDLPPEHRERAAHDAVQYRAMRHARYRPGHQSDQGIDWQDALPGLDPKGDDYREQRRQIEERHARYRDRPLSHDPLEAEIQRRVQADESVTPQQMAVMERRQAIGAPLTAREAERPMGYLETLKYNARQQASRMLTGRGGELLRPGDAAPDDAPPLPRGTPALRSPAARETVPDSGPATTTGGGQGGGAGAGGGQGGGQGGGAGAGGGPGGGAGGGQGGGAGGGSLQDFIIRQSVPAMAYFGAKRMAQGAGRAASPFIGETEGAVAGSMGSTVAGTAVGAGILGAGIATTNPLLMAQGAGMLGKEVINLPGKLHEWTEALLKSKEAIGQFNQAIASAQAVAELRGVQRAFQSGQRTGGAYSGLSDAYQDFQDAVQPIKDSSFNAIARDVANGVRDLTALVGIVRTGLQKLGVLETDEELAQRSTPFQDTVAAIKAGGFAAEQNEKWAQADLEGGHSGAGMGGLPAGWGRKPPGGHTTGTPPAQVGPLKEMLDLHRRYGGTVERPHVPGGIAKWNPPVDRGRDPRRDGVDPDGPMPEVQPRMPSRFRNRQGQRLPKVRPQPNEEENSSGVSLTTAALVNLASAGSLTVPYLLHKLLSRNTPPDTAPPRQTAGTPP